MEFVTVRIVNWEKYQTKTKDIKRPWWFALSNTLVEDPAFYDFTAGQFKAWIYILSQASKQQKCAVQIFFKHAQIVSNISRLDMEKAIQNLVKIGACAIWSDSGHDLVGLQSAHYITLQNKTEQNNTQIAQPSMGEFEILYQEYPRKEGKSRGMAKLKSQIKTPEEFDLLRKAIQNYKAHCVSRGLDAQYIKQFSTFVSEWRDWSEVQESESYVANKPRLVKEIGPKPIKYPDYVPEYKEFPEISNDTQNLIENMKSKLGISKP